MRKFMSLMMLLFLGYFSFTFINASQSDSNRIDAATRAMPEDEKSFVSTAADYGGSKFIYAKPLEVFPMRRARAAAFCSIHGDGIVKGWVGRVEQISATNRGDAILRVYLYGGGTVELENWNERTDAVADKLPVTQTSRIFSAITGLKRLQLIKFDGEFQPDASDCFRTNGSQIATDEGNMAATMMDPIFIFRFTNVQPLD